MSKSTIPHGSVVDLTLVPLHTDSTGPSVESRVSVVDCNALGLMVVPTDLKHPPSYARRFYPWTAIRTVSFHKVGH